MRRVLFRVRHRSRGAGNGGRPEGTPASPLRARPWPRPERRAPCERLPRRRSSTAGRCRGRRSRITPRGLHEPSAPYCASPIVCDRPSGHGDTAQLSAGHEGDRAAVGRPDRADDAFGARDRPRLERVERAQPDGLRSRWRRSRRRRAGARRARALAGRRPGGPRGSGPESGRPAAGFGARRAQATAKPIAASPASAAIAQAVPSRTRRRVATIPGSPAREPPSAIHCELRRTSRALCQRSSGSFSRHLRTTWSSAGGRHAPGRSRSAAAAPTRSRRSGSCGSCLRRRGGRWPSRRARRPARRCRCARRPAGPRAAPAPCTGTCRRSCPAR